MGIKISSCTKWAFMVKIGPICGSRALKTPYLRRVDSLFILFLSPQLVNFRLGWVYKK